MTPNLKLVEPPSEENLTLNALLYGPAKVGKTTGATSAPGKKLLLNADRPNASRYAHTIHGDQLDEVQAEGLDTLVAVIEAVRGGAYDTVIVDPIGELYRVVLEDLSQRSLRVPIQLYGDTGTHIERFCRSLCDLPVNVVLVAHERETDSEEAEFLPFTGTKNPVFAEKLMAMVDVFGYTGIVKDEETKKLSYMVQLFNGGGRRGGARWPWETLRPSRELDLVEWIETASANAGTDTEAQSEAA